ncbi:hypothetical protein AVEN_24877-1 [Araneus ventricosus]|uniref:Uncharacterized protein n=1 Tax=Araneus ventricosus TaxID=182803 RepID=A0A4Y2JQT9_ARAVE|nr:hypothetical protein AVEN_24877-1 [Araneus ventricosus]
MDSNVGATRSRPPRSHEDLGGRRFDLGLRDLLIRWPIEVLLQNNARSRTDSSYSPDFCPGAHCCTFDNELFQVKNVFSSPPPQKEVKSERSREANEHFVHFRIKFPTFRHLGLQSRLLLTFLDRNKF